MNPDFKPDEIESAAQAAWNARDAYRVNEDAWVTTGALATSRELHTATLLANGDVLVAGGLGNAATTLRSAERYDAVRSTWQSAGSLGTGRFLHTATLLPTGEVLIVGGFGDFNIYASVEIYDAAANSWRAGASLETARYQHRATLLPDGRVLVTGGHDLLRKSAFAVAIRGKADIAFCGAHVGL